MERWREEWMMDGDGDGLVVIDGRAEQWRRLWLSSALSFLGRAPRPFHHFLTAGPHFCRITQPDACGLFEMVNKKDFFSSQHPAKKLIDRCWCASDFVQRKTAHLGQLTAHTPHFGSSNAHLQLSAHELLPRSTLS